MDGITKFTNYDDQITLCLPGELKQIIEAAAGTLGQTLSEFVVSTVVSEARQGCDKLR